MRDEVFDLDDFEYHVYGWRWGLLMKSEVRSDMVATFYTELYSFHDLIDRRANRNR